MGLSSSRHISYHASEGKALVDSGDTRRNHHADERKGPGSNLHGVRIGGPAHPYAETCCGRGGKESLGRCRTNQLHDGAVPRGACRDLES
mmetsp:Transcript_5041/g.11010  ORF Transcript_5041/g.11010 Transcript_5041/m.11010 type:complete len:90 (-) Transcript_5041:1642-1911(-)